MSAGRAASGKLDTCPNFPPCGHSVLMHRVSDDAFGYVCMAVDRVPDDRQQRYVEARCHCGGRVPAPGGRMEGEE